MKFSRLEYWSGLPFPFPGDLPDPGIEPGSPTLQADALPSEPPGKPSHNVETTQMSINVCTSNGIIFSLRKEGNSDSLMDKA